MINFEKFIFPDLNNDMTDCSDRGAFYNNSYPFHLTSDMGSWSLDFEPITILCGGNGLGKSTILNVIGQKLHALSMYNTSACFQEYVDKCHY